MIPFPLLFNCRMRVNNPSRSAGVRLEVGSSNPMILAPRANVRAISTTCSSAIPRLETRVVTESRGASGFKISLAFAWNSARLTTLSALVFPRKMFCATSSCGTRLGSWLTKPTPSARACRGSSMATSPWPSISIVPESGGCTPKRIFIKVDLPAPFSPIRAWTSPALRSKSTPFSAWTPANALMIPFNRSSTFAEGSTFGVCIVSFTESDMILLLEGGRIGEVLDVVGGDDGLRRYDPRRDRLAAYESQSRLDAKHALIIRKFGHRGPHFASADGSLGFTDAVSADHRDLFLFTAILDRLKDTQGHAVIVSVNSPKVGVLPQDVGGHIQSGHPIPVIRLTRDQLQVARFLDRLGKPLNPLACVGRTGLPFDLGNLGAIGIELVQKFPRTSPDGNLVSADVGAGTFSPRIVDYNGGNIKLLGRL